MKIRVLGSSGSKFPDHRTSSMLINGSVLLDAGNVAAALSLDGQVAISDVLLTHAHLDHMADLAFLVDNVFTLRTEPVRVWAPGPVLQTLRRHVFNDEVWPDFTRLPDTRSPALVFVELPVGNEVEIGGLQVRWAQTNHPVFSAAYRLCHEGSAVLFSGDTGPTDALWQLGREGAELKAAFVETTFPNRLHKLAETSGHLTPAMLQGELAKLGREQLPVKILHLKAQFLDEISRELSELGDHRLQILRGGEEFHF